MTPRGLTPEDRFWMKVLKGGPDDCWWWAGAMSGRYGKLFIGREYGRSITVYAHRFSWELAFGPIPAGMEVDHLCNNAWCVNPCHFELVSPEENKSRQGERQTECLRGHAYTEANTYRDGRGQRRCRRCADERRAA